MGLQDLFTWRTHAAAAILPDIADDDLVADVDEPPDHRKMHQPGDFQKSVVRVQSDQNESLLTKALKTPETSISKLDVHAATDLPRRPSMTSNASLASTAELTSDGVTSPSRTNTPSPPPPNAIFTGIAPFSLSTKSIYNSHVHPAATTIGGRSPPPQSVVPKKRCITFACGGGKNSITTPAAPPTSHMAAATEVPKRVSTIKFACSAPKATDKPFSDERPRTPQTSKALDPPRKNDSRSPSATRKSPRSGLVSSRSQRDSTPTVRHFSQSPSAVRSRPSYIASDDKILSSEATRFHEFASEELQEDDWIRKESDGAGKRLTIYDTLKKENDIRRLGNEAEEEALEEDEQEEEDRNGSDDENGFDEDEDIDSDDTDSSHDAASDGNETDNEAGFADSDEENDVDDEFAFWTPRKNLGTGQAGGASTYRASAHRTASTSSIDTLNRSTSSNAESGKRGRRPHPIKIRPRTPDLPDSTDFVCGTLDEDRPLEEAYVSRMEARKNAKHKQTPQDIDPSFPTSDTEDEEDEHDTVEVHDSDEHIWLHGKFEDSDEGRHSRRRSTTYHKSQGQSPKHLRSPPPSRRLHSPPPTKTRLRSPPPRKLFGHSPKRMRSPPPARMIYSPPASLMVNASIGFAPLGSRPGLTHTKSLPRAPNAFSRQYIAAANGNYNDGHVRGAIDIVKGLEQKRQRRKEKFYAKQNTRKGKGQTERRPHPGIGAERMRELGLLMAGKAGANDPYMLSA